jgi:hypothetical protein
LDGIGIPFNRRRGQSLAHSGFDFRVIMFHRIFTPINSNVQNFIVIIIVQCLKARPVAAATGHSHGVEPPMTWQDRSCCCFD